LLLSFGIKLVVSHGYSDYCCVKFIQMTPSNYTHVRAIKGCTCTVEYKQGGCQGVVCTHPTHCSSFSSAIVGSLPVSPVKIKFNIHQCHFLPSA
jgi:hypothetical protein